MKFDLPTTMLSFTVGGDHLLDIDAIDVMDMGEDLREKEGWLPIVAERLTAKAGKPVSVSQAWVIWQLAQKTSESLKKTTDGWLQSVEGMASTPCNPS